ncbi:MAG: hypothetical protein AAGI68_05070 [Planctomycetota bacterium]
MCKRVAQYTLIVIAGYLLTGLPTAAKVCCLGCGDSNALADTTPISHSTAVPAPSQGCCAVVIPIEPSPTHAEPSSALASPGSEDTPSTKKHCSGAPCCKAAPTLTPPAPKPSPLLACGTPQALLQALAPTEAWPLDPPPPRG